MGVLARKIEQQGIEKGKVEGKIEVAKAMLNADSDLQFIIKVTGLTEEEAMMLLIDDSGFVNCVDNGFTYQFHDKGTDWFKETGHFLVGR